jgi:uncharacterized protein YneF (UPF0154 family)
MDWWLPLLIATLSMIGFLIIGYALFVLVGEYQKEVNNDK